MSIRKSIENDPQAIEAAIMEFIETAYQHRTATTEPSIGVSLLVDWFRCHAYTGHTILGSSWRPDQYRIVAAACARLVKGGKLEASTGISRTGREERHYNPAPRA